MKTKTWLFLALLGLAALVIAGVTFPRALLIREHAALAAVQEYDLSWWTVDGGGGQSSGGSYILRGTIAQPDAGLSGGNYRLEGGFWGGGLISGAQGNLYLPLLFR
jgi:hypothetical protein